MIARPVIVQHCFGELGLGGPMSGVHRLLGSKLRDKYHFETCFQSCPAGGINLNLIWEMAAKIRSFHPQLLHVRGLGNEGFHGLMAGRLAGCPRILVSVHGMQRDSPPSFRQRIVAHILEPYTLRHADGVYCVCAYAERREIISHNARQLYGYVHNAVDLPQPSKSALAIRVSFGFAETDTVAVYVGRLSIEKGLIDLLSAVQLLAMRYEHRVKVLIVGDGPDRALLEATAAKFPPGQVVFTGRRTDVNDLMQAGDYVVLPSHHENLANTLVEAMACGRPIIASRVGGNPEVVIDGETGIIVPSHDATALADAMHLLARDPDLCVAYGIAGRKRAESVFSMTLLESKLDKIYQDLLQI
jgi:glycosyltransferase involved in cell wall biosynthesis